MNVKRCWKGIVLLALGAALCGCSKARVGATDTAAFSGAWSGTWDARWERGTSTFKVAPDGSFSGTMYSTILHQTWPFNGSFKAGAFTGNVVANPRDTYVINGSAIVYDGKSLKSQGLISLRGKTLGPCTLDLKR